MLGWVATVLRAVGIQRAADVVPVITRAGEAIADAVQPDEPSQPLSHQDVDWIEQQRDAATAHKVPQRPK